MTPLPLLALLALLPLAIPVAIVVGSARPSGPMVVCGAGAALAFAVFWLVFGGPGIFRGGASGQTIVALVTLVGGMLLLLAALTLSIADAALARRWAEVALLTAMGYASGLALLVTVAPPDPCLFGPPSSGGPFAGACALGGGPSLGELLVVAGYVVGPAAALAYARGVRASSAFRLRRTRTLPEGLSVSRLGAEGDPSVAPDAPMRGL